VTNEFGFAITGVTGPETKVHTDGPLPLILEPDNVVEEAQIIVLPPAFTVQLCAVSELQDPIIKKNKKALKSNFKFIDTEGLIINDYY